MNDQPVVKVRALTVSYADQPALDQVSLSVAPGEVHALIGHNGAGKSTLAACLISQLEPDGGTISLRGRVALVTQHPQVIPDKPVAMTVWLGHEPQGCFGVSARRAIIETRAVADRAGIDLDFLGIDPAALGRTLTPVQCQIVALLAALATDPAVLIADEATAGAARADRHLIAATLQSVAASGVGVLMITHYADEVARVADRMTVLRSATAHGPYRVTEFAEAAIRAAMAGDVTGLTQVGNPRRTLENRGAPVEPDHSEDTTVLHSQADGDMATPQDAPAVATMVQQHPPAAVAGGRQGQLADRAQTGLMVWAPNHDGPGVPISQRPPLLVAPAGQVSVILGAARDGISPLMAAITGTEPMPGWACRLSTDQLTGHPLHRRRAMGLGWVPDHRTVNGPAPGLSIAENLAMAFPRQPASKLPSPSASRSAARNPDADYSEAGRQEAGRPEQSNLEQSSQDRPGSVGPPNGQPHLWWHGYVRPIVRRQATAVLTERWRALNGIAGRRTISQLSGGQAQAVMVGRELAPNPRVLVLNNPQHGMDPGAMGDLAAMLREHAQRGHVVLVTTTDRTFAQMVGDQFWRATNGTITPIAPLPHMAYQGQPPRVVTPPHRPPRHIPGPLIALLLGLVLMAGVIGLWGASPTQVVTDLVHWSWGTPAGQAALLAHLVPLLVIGAGVAIMFRAEVISIGAEGQLYLGALAAGIIGQSTGLPGPVVGVLAILGGALAGALWAAPAAILKAWVAANEIVVTLILNALGVLICAWMVAGPFNAGQGALTTAAVNPAARLPERLVGPVGLDVVIAVAVLAIAAMVLAWSRWGLGTRYLGFGEARAQVMGINPKARQAQVLIIGGALAGLAGALVVLGPAGGRFNMVFSPGYGFMAITVALVGAYRGWGLFLAGLGFATLMAGAGAIQLSAGIPLAITGVIQGVLVLAVTMQITLPKRHHPNLATPTVTHSTHPAAPGTICAGPASPMPSTHGHNVAERFTRDNGAGSAPSPGPIEGG